jgi:integrase
MGRARGRRNGSGGVVTIRRGRGRKVIGYKAVITVGWRDGKRLRAYSDLCKEREDADAALLTLLEQHRQGVDLLAKPQSLLEFLRGWLGGHEGRPKTIDTYGWIIEDVVGPKIGSLPLKQVTTPRLRAFLADLKLHGVSGKRRASPKTITLIRGMLRTALEQAYQDGLISRNPVDAIKRPALPPSPAKVLTPEQAAALLDALPGERLGAAIQLALLLGMRRGEIAALKRDDLNLDADPPTLTVNGTLTAIRGKGLVLGPPKTKAGRRTLRLPAQIVAALTWHLNRQVGEIAAMKGVWGPDEGYIFVSPKTGGPLNPAAIYTAFKRVATLAGLDGYRLHDLRHSAASYLHKLRWQTKDISAQLGHASTTITANLYIHLFSDSHAGGDDIERLLNAASAEAKRRAQGGK